MPSPNRSVKQLGIFAKYWAAGRVKTRLGGEIGVSAAAELYRCFVATLCGRLASVDADRTVYFTPRERRAEFRELLAASWSLAPQSEGDLGQRMRAYFENTFGLGYERVILLGSDSPHVPTETVDAAFELLTTCQVVLGPSLDGGYYLIGARHRIPDLFGEIPWSSADVWSDTIARLHANGFESGRGYAILPPCLDVDTGKDLRMLRGFLENDESAADPHLRDLRKAVRGVCPDEVRER